MINEYKIKNKKLRLNWILMTSILLSTIILSIGYAGINPITLNVETKATASAQTGVFITDVNLVESKNIGKAKVLNIYSTMLQTDISLSANSTDTYVKYEIEVYNSTADRYYFYEANYEGLYTNNDIKFDLEGIQKGDVLNSRGYKTFYITFTYNTTIVPAENELESYIDFVFRKAYNVTYQNITNNSYPNYAFNGEKFVVSLTNVSNPIEVTMNGAILSSSSYTYSDHTLTIPNASGDINIRQLNKYTITNLVVNGSFENAGNNLYAWGISGDTSMIGIASIPRDGSYCTYRKPSGEAKNFLKQNLSWITNHKYYYFGYAISVTPQTFACNITNIGAKFIVTTNSKYYAKGSTIYTSTFTGTNMISVNYAATTDSVNVDSIGVVDLTEAFGEGNEPDLEWCNANIDYFDGSTIVYK